MRPAKQQRQHTTEHTINNCFGSFTSCASQATMSKPSFFLVSLPTSISPSNDRDEALTALRSVITTDNGDTSPFTIPSFKIGTLDALVQQADDLGKVAGGCEGVVGKVADSLNSLLEGDGDKIAQQKTVNDSQSCTYNHR